MKEKENVLPIVNETMVKVDELRTADKVQEYQRKGFIEASQLGGSTEPEILKLAKNAPVKGTLVSKASRARANITDRVSGYSGVFSLMFKCTTDVTGTKVVECEIPYEASQSLNIGSTLPLMVQHWETATKKGATLKYQA